jgi:hypothetical protein
MVLTSVSPWSLICFDRGQRLNRLGGSPLKEVDANPGLHADGGHGVAEDVVELAGDAQPFLDRAAAGLLLAGLGLAGKLSAGGHQQRPVVADRRAGSASSGGQQDGAAIGPGRLGSAEGHADRHQRVERGHHRAGQPPPPSPQGREGVAGDQWGQRDQTAGILGGRPGQGDRIEDNQHRYRVAAAQCQGAGHNPDQPDRHGVEWTRADDPRGSGAGPAGGQQQHRHPDANTGIGEDRCGFAHGAEHPWCLHPDLPGILPAPAGHAHPP